MSSIHRNPTEESFIIWLSNYPESFHPLDMERFYVFVHNVNSYHATKWLNKDYFEKQIKLHNPGFEQENIDRFYEILEICNEYFNTPKMRGICLDRSTNWNEVRVINHKIVSEPIEDIEKYMSKSAKSKS